MIDDEPELKGDDRLTKAMYDACQAIMNCFIDGAPFKVTILVRCTTEEAGHVTCGNDSFEGAIEGLQALIDDKDTVLAQIVSRGPIEPTGTLQ